MNPIHLLTIRPKRIKELFISDRLTEMIGGIRREFNLKGEERDGLVEVIRDLVLGLQSIDNYPQVLQKKLTSVSEKDFPIIQNIIDRNFISLYKDDLYKTQAEVEAFKRENNLPVVVSFDVSAESSNKSGNQEGLVDAPEQKKVPVKNVAKAEATKVSPEKRGVPSPPPIPRQADSSDIRPVRRPKTTKSIPKKTPLQKPDKKMEASPKADKKYDKFVLNSLEDLENIPVRSLDLVAGDTEALKAELKKQIQNIANVERVNKGDIVQSWKQSKIYKAYVEMGNDSMQQGKSIPEVVTWRKASSNDYLTEDQFHAVADVSRLLQS